VVEERDGVAFPDTLVGTDSHTTMINGLGVLGWGVGGIEAEAAMLGEPLSMLVPQVVGFRLHGSLPEGRDGDRPRAHLSRSCCARPASSASSSSTSAKGSRRCRSPTARRSGTCRPEYGATCGFFPGRRSDARVPAPHGRDPSAIALVEAYCKENLLWHDRRRPAEYSQVVELDLSSVEPSLAGPAAAAGPRAARAREGELRRGARDVRRRRTRTAARQGGRRHVPASDPTTSSAGAEASRSRRRACRARASRAPRVRVRGATTSSTTARS
jgi:aconitate hydratase